MGTVQLLAPSGRNEVVVPRNRLHWEPNADEGDLQQGGDGSQVKGQKFVQVKDSDDRETSCMATRSRPPFYSPGCLSEMSAHLLPIS